MKSSIALLGAEGFGVFAARLGKEDLEILQNKKIAAAIVDIRRPGIDGDETITKGISTASSPSFHPPHRR